MKQKLLYLVLPLFFLCVQSICAQQQQVSGTILDSENGMPIPGVTISEKGTGNGTVSDFDGNYTIEVSSGATLVFSMIGFTTQEVAVAGKNEINVNFVVSTEALNEVVITALGIKREVKKLGYAMTEVSGEELAKTNTVNPVQALQGKVAGVSIGASDGGLFGNSKIQIRGVSSLNSTNNQPIFVIDGVILENTESKDNSADWAASANDYGNILKNLNPDDYKSVSVLKGAAATALYGSRGINGVVLIETKDGSGSRGIGVSVKQSIGIDYVFDTPDLQNQFGPGTLAGYIGYGNRDENNNFYRFDTGQFYYNNEGQATLIGHAGGGLSYGPRFDGSLIEDYDGSLIPYVAQKNNMKDAYETGINTNTSFSVSGANDKGSFYLSDSYNKRTGTLPSNSFERNAILFRATYNLTPWLKASGSMSFTQSNAQNALDAISQNFFEGGFERIYNTEKYSQRRFWQAPHGGVPNAQFNDEFAFAPNSGLWFNYNTIDDRSKETVSRPVITLSAEATDWLTITAQASANDYTTKYESKALGSGYANEGGQYVLNHSRDLTRNGKITFDIHKDISEDISSTLLIGAEIFDQEKSYSNVRTDGGLIVPGRFFMDNSRRNLISDAGIFGTKQINSLYFLSSFGYKDQLFLDITGRNDWSSALVYTNGTGTNSYFYPSVSSSWLLSETFKTPDWVTFGKLRASWAQVGSDTDPYVINPGYAIGRYEMNDGNFVYNNSISKTLVNRELIPERKNSYEFGLDARFLNNRLGVDFAYYNETIKNQIGNVPVNAEAGYTQYLTNIGTLSNYGVELSLYGSPVKTQNFEWNATFNYWNNTTKVKDLDDAFGGFKTLGGDISYGNFRIGSVAFEDGEYGVLMSDSAIKTWQSVDDAGNPIDDPRNGMKLLTYSDSRRGAYYQRSGTVEKVGKVQPDFEGSLSNEFTYKGVSLSVLLDARYGGHIASYSSRYGTAYGYLDSSLRGRDEANGGVSWTSQYSDIEGRTYSDGIIPEGIFQEGQMITAPSGESVNVGGMTYQEAYDQGLVEPTHASFYNYFTNSWGQGVVNDNWFKEVKYIAIRNISLGYNLPKSISDKLNARNLYIGVNARNLGYIYNSLPNNINPESFRGTGSADSFRERSFTPYTASYTMTISLDF
ncbi:SusC/RagA family TonB-linked outer membrane protein [Leeuwenhoekiella sp. W20_SRS_FM14]|uniref:SusC/RagA family TonB-linked outer membrane protein n=1 Tax=Leeuwenhoekiella sp. W20_SRS_FM14 TaxID=3240270 RepID=UPI003F9843BB